MKGASLMHDWAMTEHHVLFFDLPIVFDAEWGAKGGFPYRWDDDYGARIGIMPKVGASGDVRWFDIEPCMVIHSLNAYEDGAAIVLEAPRYPATIRDRWSPDILAIDTAATLHRWRFDPGSGVISEQAIDERTLEFPTLNPARLGERGQVGYGVATARHDGPHTTFGSLLKWDLGNGTCQTHPVGAGRSASEASFVADPAAGGEDEGWLLSYVYDPGRDASDLVIVDATAFAGPPQAVIELPARVPQGFHGCWIPNNSASSP